MWDDTRVHMRVNADKQIFVAIQFSFLFKASNFSSSKCF